VAGAGAATNAQALFKMLAGYPELMSRLAVAERIGDRRWSLKLTHGPEIDLPADAEAEALARLMARRRGGRLIDRDVAGLDLRVADQIVVRRDPVKTSRAAARPH
jgi:cell division septal protein FtsQ